MSLEGGDVVGKRRFSIYLRGEFLEPLANLPLFFLNVGGEPLRLCPIGKASFGAALSGVPNSPSAPAAKARTEGSGSYTD